MSVVKLRAEIWAASSIESACEQIMRLSRRLEVDVIADFNGVTLIAQPNGTAKALQENWAEEMKSDRPYKTASSRPKPEVMVEIINAIPVLVDKP